MTKRRRGAGISEAQAMAQYGDLAALAVAQPAAYEAATALAYAEDYASSQIRNMARAQQPHGLANYIRWLRHAYSLEPPIRLHRRAVGQDGNPAFTGEFAAWLASADSAVACDQDKDGYFLRPLRCAIYTMHGPHDGTDEALMADYVLALAVSDWPYDLVAKTFGITPHWVIEVATKFAVERIWQLYTPWRALR